VTCSPLLSRSLALSGPGGRSHSAGGRPVTVWAGCFRRKAGIRRAALKVRHEVGGRTLQNVGPDNLPAPAVGRESTSQYRGPAEKKHGADDVNGAGEPEDKRLTDGKHGGWPEANDRDARIASLQGHKDRSVEEKPQRAPLASFGGPDLSNSPLHFVAARVILPSADAQRDACASRRFEGYHQSTAPRNLQYHEVGRRLRRCPPKVSTVERSRLVGGDLLCAEDVQHD
jgi:hypothetical protein